jgi:hypothetical protein
MLASQRCFTNTEFSQSPRRSRIHKLMPFAKDCIKRSLLHCASCCEHIHRNHLISSSWRLTVLIALWLIQRVPPYIVRSTSRQALSCFIETCFSTFLTKRQCPHSRVQSKKAGTLLYWPFSNCPRSYQWNGYDSKESKS